MKQADSKQHKRAAQVADKYDGILPMYEAFYIEALMYSAGRAQAAFMRFDEAIASADDAATIVAIAHEALSHVAALSRFFWPARGKPLHDARAQNLREALGLDETSPLASRDLRNALEHFDERLDLFLLEDMAGYFFPDPIIADASLSDDVLGHIFRLVDPATETFVLLGEKYSFGPMRVAVNDVLRKLRGMIGGRFAAYHLTSRPQIPALRPGSAHLRDFVGFDERLPAPQGNANPSG